MKIYRSIALSISVLATALLLFSCDSKRGEPREVQLEKTATDLEAKAEKIRNDVDKNSEMKHQKAKTLRDENGNSETADLLEKDATVTKKVGEMRAVQLEKKAEEVRDKKDDVLNDQPVEEKLDIAPK